MQVRAILEPECECARALLAANGWADRVGSPEHFAQLLHHSQHTVVAVIDDRVVGFARAITDGLSNGYLSMVVVAAPYRKQGVGRALVEHIVGSDTHITWVLRAGRDGAAGFFERLDFRASSIAMEKVRVASGDSD